MTLFPKCAIRAKMKTFLVILLCFFAENVPLTRGVECPPSPQRMDIKDTDVGVDFIALSLPSTATFIKLTIQDNTAINASTAITYFTAGIADSTFTVSTTNAFKNLGIDADSNGDKMIVFTMYAELTCENTNLTTIIVLRVSDTYSHNPQLPAEAYTYSIPMPIMTKTDITIYGDEINITDINFSNTEMTLSVSPDDFAITAAKTDNKHFKAVFSARSILQFSEDQNYVLTASNSGGKTSTAQITIKVDPVAGLDAPSFTKSYYSFDYSDEGQGSLTPKDGNIGIKSDKSNEAQYKLDGDLASSFKITFFNESLTFQLVLDTPLPSDIYGQVVLTLSYTTDATTNAILLVNIVKTEVIPKFSKDYYAGTYDVDTDDMSWAQEISIANASEVKLAEGKSNLFTIDKSTYKITPVNPLSKSDFDDNSNIIFKVIAASSSKNESQAVVVVSLKTVVSEELQFDRAFYSATYSIQNEAGVVTLDTDIGFLEISDFTGINVQVDDAYKANFKVGVDSSKWKISVPIPLNDTILNRNTELAIPIVATKTGLSVQASAVLILTLPEQVQIKFGNSYYTGSYSLGTDSDSVELDQKINISGDKLNNIKITVEEYDKNFELALDESGTLSIQVKQNLNSSVLESHHQLIITITASATNGGATADTVLILDLPDVERKLAFSEKYYTAFYQTDSGGSVQLDEAIAVNSKGYTNIQVAFESLEDNFEFESASPSGSYSIKVKKPLNDTVLALNNQLVIVITASDLDSTASTSAILLIKLPSFSNNAFENEHYVAEYKSSTDSASKDEVNVIGDRIKVKTADYSSISFAGYEGNFEGTCDSSTLECVITVKSNLNGSILSSNDELLVTLIASNADRSNIGKTVLMLTLPSKNSTFSFSKQHYGAIYSIQKSNDVKATIELSDVISLQGAESADVSILIDDYPEYFKITLDSSIYNINILKNLDISLLSAASELVTSLTANKTGQNTQDYAKATLVIKLPDSTTVAFKKPQYYGEYVIDDPSNPQVVLDSDSPIEASDFENSKIVLDSFTENFAVELGSDSKWNVNSKISLNSSILSQYSELKLVMTITKIGVSYGNAALNIRLPSLSFAKNLYWGSYSVDDSGVGSISDIEIEIANVDPSYIEINLTRYSENFYTELTNNKWTVKIGTPLPAVTSGPLVINLEATRISDNKILATTVLVIRLPNENVADAPKFSNYTFFGNYKNSDVPTVELRELIGLSDDSTDSECEIFIDSTDEYSTNFSLKVEDNDQYSVNVATPLSQDVLDNLTNVVFTLVAKSTEGKYGFAALVISLPKALRNTSVQVEDEEILFTGTYQDGAFKSPRITLKTNSTDSDDISVKISNDLGIDDSYFTSSYSDGVLLIQVGELPQDVLNKTSVIPLKLAITDRSTQDTVRAVLNIEIDGNSDDNSGHGGNATDSAHVGLLVAVIILAVLLLLLLLGAFLFWFFKLRGTRSADMTDDELSITTKSTSFTKNEIKKPTTGLSSASIRRPTGLPIGLMNTVAEESTSDQGVLVSVDKSPYSEFEKKVAFDDKVENIDQDENDDDNDESSEGLQSVADRRPTKFVFGYPLEAGLFDEEDGRRESSDCITNPEGEDELPAGERKKSVAFDENIERMHIDRVEDDEDEEESGSEDNNKEEPNSTEDSFKTEAKLQVGGDEKLPSEIFKEIF